MAAFYHFIVWSQIVISNGIYNQIQIYILEIISYLSMVAIFKFLGELLVELIVKQSE